MSHYSRMLRFAALFALVGYPLLAEEEEAIRSRSDAENKAFSTLYPDMEGALYRVEGKWDGKWHRCGKWVIGSRSKQPVMALDIEGDGYKLRGTVTYKGEGPIDFKGKHTEKGHYMVKVRWGGPGAAWRPEGCWKMGGKDGVILTSLSITAKDGGDRFRGEMSFKECGDDPNEDDCKNPEGKCGELRTCVPVRGWRID